MEEQILVVKILVEILRAKLATDEAALRPSVTL